MEFETFEIKCKKCGSTDVYTWIQMYDSCDNEGAECNKCGNKESRW